MSTNQEKVIDYFLMLQYIVKFLYIRIVYTKFVKWIINYFG